MCTVRGMAQPSVSAASNIARGLIAGVGGTVVMTAFQRLVEMPLTGRGDSYAPADFAEKVLPITARSDRERKQLNYATHFALGTMWGAAYGLAANAGLSGQRAAMTVFAAVYTSDVLLNTALGLYDPKSWSVEDWVIDVTEKLIQAEVTGLVFDRVLAK